MLKIGYVICPSGIVFSKYVETCFKTETISITTEKGQVHHNCKIDVKTLQEIEFPDIEKKEITGSLIIWDFQENIQKPIVLGTFSRNDQARFILPYQYRFLKNYKGNSASTTIDGKEAKITIATYSQNIANFILRVIGKAKAKILLETDGFFHVKAVEKVQIQSGEIYLGNKEFEQSVLGNTLKDEILDPLLNEIQKLTVPTAFGPSGVPINNPQFKEIQSKLENILSLINNLQ